MQDNALNPLEEEWETNGVHDKDAHEPEKNLKYVDAFIRRMLDVCSIDSKYRSEGITNDLTIIGKCLEGFFSETIKGKTIVQGNVTYIKEQNITVESGASFYNGSQPSQKKEKQGDNIKEIVANLKGAFYGNTESAAKFLEDISGLKPTQVINCVGVYIKRKELSNLSCHRDLWQILHDNGYYDPCESNWNKGIKNL